MLTYVNKSIDALNKIDISKLPKPQVSDSWGLGNSSQNDQHDQHRTPPPPKDYEFMEYSELDAAGTIIVSNFIWVNAESNLFTQDELKKTIKTLSILKKLYSSLNTFLEEKIAELEPEKIKQEAKPITAETITEDAIQNITITKQGGRKRRTKRYKKRSSKRKHRKSMSKRR